MLLGGCGLAVAGLCGDLVGSAAAAAREGRRRRRRGRVGASHRGKRGLRCCAGWSWLTVRECVVCPVDAPAAEQACHGCCGEEVCFALLDQHCIVAHAGPVLQQGLSFACSTDAADIDGLHPQAGPPLALAPPAPILWRHWRVPRRCWRRGAGAHTGSCWLGRAGRRRRRRQQLGGLPRGRP